MKALYHTFGCKLNFAETVTLGKILSDRGIDAVDEGSAPDLIVINSCAVTEQAEKKCRQQIRTYHRRWPSAMIAVMGCYSQLRGEQLWELPGVAVVAGNDNKLRVADYIEDFLRERKRCMEIIPAKEIRDFVPSCQRGDRTRYFLKVQDGCDYFCSYCTIPYARGRSRSASVESLVAQARQVASEGGKEIVLTGVNIGDFGRGSSETFFDLIRALDEVEGIERYRISSIEPNLLTDEMIRWVATSRSFMPHFHIPLQAGDDEVLRLMRRRYRTDLFRHRIETIREVIPHAFIGVDLIVGARGETSERFDSSRQFVESLPITRLHVFPYSERAGTRALTDIDFVVDQTEKHRRAAIMGQISDRKIHEFFTGFIGSTRPVLVEHTSRDGVMTGFTDNYIRVAMPDTPELYNQIVNVRLTSLRQGEEMIGEILK